MKEDLENKNKGKEENRGRKINQKKERKKGAGIHKDQYW